MYIYYIYGKTVHTFFRGKNPWYISGGNVFAPKTVFAYTVHTVLSFQVFTMTMGEALIYLVRQYLALCNKQDMMYKDSSYKEAKWKEIVEILHLNKEEVIRKW